MLVTKDTSSEIKLPKFNNKSVPIAIRVDDVKTVIEICLIHLPSLSFKAKIPKIAMISIKTR